MAEGGRKVRYPETADGGCGNEDCPIYLDSEWIECADGGIVKCGACHAFPGRPRMFTDIPPELVEHPDHDADERFDFDDDPNTNADTARSYLRWLVQLVRSRVSTVHTIAQATEYIYHTAKRGDALFAQCAKAREIQEHHNWRATSINQYAKPASAKTQATAKRRSVRAANKERVRRDLPAW